MDGLHNDFIPGEEVLLNAEVISVHIDEHGTCYKIRIRRKGCPNAFVDEVPECMLSQKDHGI